MWWSLLGTALVMGLVGGPHCLAMCAAPCGLVTAARRAETANLPQAAAVPLLLFHGGRLAGYAALGAAAAWAMEQLSWLSARSMALQPLWTLVHVAVLAWGLLLLCQARQPLWLEQAGRRVWQKVQPVLAAPSGRWMAGMAWALMPCGLLYSAVLVAALSGGPLLGALSMLAFGLGSGLWLVLAPWGWQRIRRHVGGWRAQWGPRVAGLLLIGVAVGALWMDLIYKPSLWCR